MATKIKDFVIAVGTSATNSGTADIALVISANPEVNDTLTLGNTTFTFVDTTPTGSEIEIGAVLADTLNNIVSVATASAENALVQVTEDGTDTVTVAYRTAGPAGNAYPVAWNFATATIDPDGAGATSTGSTTLAGGGITLTGGSGFKAIELWGDGSVRFSRAGEEVTIRDVDANKLWAEIMRDEDNGVGPDFVFFGVTP